MISGLVLAAGTASRFGRTKQLELVDGKPLAQHAVDALFGVEELIVVTGHDAPAVEEALFLPENGMFVRNPAFRASSATAFSRYSRAFSGLPLCK